MEAKAYLKQIRKLDSLIENKLAEKERWMAIATCVTPRLSADKVQSSSNLQKMTDAVDRYIEIEKEINEYIDRLVDTKREVISTIEMLSATDYDVLHKLYVQFLNYDEVADRCGKSRSWATTVHGRALKKVQNILDARANNA